VTNKEEAGSKAAPSQALTSWRGRVVIGAAAFAWVVGWALVIYRGHTVLWLALVLGVVVGYLAATSRTPIWIRLLAGAAYLVLLLFFDLLGQLVVPR
jgi:hypothetical protein